MGSYCCALVVDFSQNDTNAVDAVYFMVSPHVYAIAPG